MCGVFGYIGEKSCVQMIYNGLKRLEYRGYDSAGIVVSDGHHLSVQKTVGKLHELSAQLKVLPDATMGMGHTRWATHGRPTEINAHPHVSGPVALIHNGIVENFKELKQELLEKGYEFVSETDTEVVLNLIIDSSSRHETLLGTLFEVRSRLEGSYALGVMSTIDPHGIYVIKQGSPVVIGLGEDGSFFASDGLALSDHTRSVVFLEDGECAVLRASGAEFYDQDGKVVQKSPTILPQVISTSEKNGFRHYMLKEIYEQPLVLGNTIRRYISEEVMSFSASDLGLDAIDLERVRQITLVACGTAYYAALSAKYNLEPLVGIPVNVELASEFRYRRPIINSHALVIAVTQSGETADTLASVKLAKEFGAQIFTICNVPFSSIVRESHSSILMDVGPEIGVASTKAYTSMVLNIYLIGLAWADRMSRLDLSRKKHIFEQLRKLPALVDQAIGLAPEIELISETYYEEAHCIFLGRSAHYPVALEGALKLKEISYIHAEGYAGGELKHGPIALIDKHMPVVALCPKDAQRSKMISNIEEVKARGGRILGVGQAQDHGFKELCERYLSCPQIDDDILQSILSVIPLQLFAYYVAVRRGTDVDQPRNLAKSVTVE